MKTKDIIAMIAVLAAGGCASNDEVQQKDPVPIRLTASVSVEAKTRSVDSQGEEHVVMQTPATRGLQENALASSEKVYLWANEDGSSSWDYLKAWTLTADGSTGLTGSTKYYPPDGTAITMNAVHGNFSSEPSEDNTAIGTLTHSVVADQSAAGGYEKSDLLFGSVTGSKASTTAENIAFTHKLSKIEVNLTAGYGYTASDIESAVVQLHNVKPTITIDPTNGNLSASATGDPITITPRKNATTGTYEAVIPAQTFTNPDALITVTTTATNLGVISPRSTLTHTSTVANDVANFAENTKYVYNVTVDKLVPEVHVGDYFYADGTWSTNYKSGHGAVVGLVFSTETSAADKAAGYTHGYVVALTNVNNVAWSTSTGLTGIGVIGYNDDTNAWKDAVLGDLDGRSHTNYITTNYPNYTTTFPAFNAAVNYSVSVSKTNYNNSGWYLPSTGQLYAFLYNFCNKTTTWPSTPFAFHVDHYGFSSQIQSATLSGLNTYFAQRLNTDIVSAGGTAVSYTTWEAYSSNSPNFWTSTEYDADYAYFLHFGGSNWLVFFGCITTHSYASYFTKTQANTTYGRKFVRPVLAF